MLSCGAFFQHVLALPDAQSTKSLNALRIFTLSPQCRLNVPACSLSVDYVEQDGRTVDGVMTLTNTCLPTGVFTLS